MGSFSPLNHLTGFCQRGVNFKPLSSPSSHSLQTSHDNSHNLCSFKLSADGRPCSSLGLTKAWRTGPCLSLSYGLSFLHRLLDPADPSVSCAVLFPLQLSIWAPPSAWNAPLPLLTSPISPSSSFKDLAQVTPPPGSFP